MDRYECDETGPLCGVDRRKIRKCSWLRVWMPGSEEEIVNGKGKIVGSELARSRTPEMLEHRQEKGK